MPARKCIICWYRRAASVGGLFHFKPRVTDPAPACGIEQYDLWMQRAKSDDAVAGQFDCGSGVDWKTTDSGRILMGWK